MVWQCKAGTCTAAHKTDAHQEPIQEHRYPVANKDSAGRCLVKGHRGVHTVPQSTPPPAAAAPPNAKIIGVGMNHLHMLTNTHAANDLGSRKNSNNKHLNLNFLV